MNGLQSWKGASSRKIVLVEAPAVQLVLDDVPLNPVVLRYPKYAQLLLASNIAAETESIVVDMKGAAGSESRLEKQCYRSMIYEGRRLDFFRIGLPDSELFQMACGTGIVGFSCNFSMERAIVAHLIAELRSKSPATLIVVGGHDATVAPKPYLDAGADLCISGEGETVIDDILSTESMEDLIKLRGISYSTSAGLKRTGKRPIHSLDRIRYPSARMLADYVYDEHPDGAWPAGVGTRFAVLETSRGCDEACNFCSSTFVSGRFRRWSIEGILRQLDETKRAGIRSLLIADDNMLYRTLDAFDGNKGREDLIVLFNALRDEGFAWTFQNGIQFGLLERDGRIDEGLVSALFKNELRDGRRIGCFEVYLPLERFEPGDILELPKLKSPATQMSIVRSIAEQGVYRCNLGFIIGTPSDSRESLSHAEEQAKRFDELIARSSSGRTKVQHLPWCSIPLPGTPNRSNYRCNIRYDLDHWPELHSNYISVIGNDEMNPIDFTIARHQLDLELNTSIAPRRSLRVERQGAAHIAPSC
ncbi:hypothetical protein C2U70_20060 [Bradyrhizobium guangdongense]|uniref:B12-binding domain-containing radical SAM protein n=1 Tax=Bradyrhizobium guangdongense TaxID=1325090 RepID=UPI00112D8285|nr:cobalamin-dependent protein [Bradyrhizobium guangdongense]TPQ33087.1 hypothetical protein C2U70_20060 [Bradyrhizobium guangdongense]